MSTRLWHVLAIMGMLLTLLPPPQRCMTAPGQQ